MSDKEDLIIYKDDNDKVVKAFVTIVEIENSYVTFLTNSNEITIPIIRVLKIKHKRGEDE